MSGCWRRFQPVLVTQTLRFLAGMISMDGCRGANIRAATHATGEQLPRKKRWEELMDRRSVIRAGGVAALAALSRGIGTPAFAQQKIVLKASDVHPEGYPTV